jgi:hypothetical protein
MFAEGMRVSVLLVLLTFSACGSISEPEPYEAEVTLHGVVRTNAGRPLPGVDITIRAYVGECQGATSLIATAQSDMSGAYEQAVNVALSTPQALSCMALEFKPNTRGVETRTLRIDSIPLNAALPTPRVRIDAILADSAAPPVVERTSVAVVEGKVLRTDRTPASGAQVDVQIQPIGCGGTVERVERSVADSLGSYRIMAGLRSPLSAALRCVRVLAVHQGKSGSTARDSITFRVSSSPPDTARIDVLIQP